MKKITMFIAFLALVGWQAHSQCNYTLEMNDSFGDGWNGGTMDVLVNGLVVLDDVTLLNPPGDQGTMLISVNSTDEITTVFGPGGSFPSEISYRILDATGTEVGAGNATNDITTGIPVTCPNCLAPSNLTVSNLSLTTVDLNWDVVANATDGYSWVVMADGEDPADMTNTPIAQGTTMSGTTMASASGLTSSTPYDAYVMSNCGMTDGDSAFSIVEEFITYNEPPACGEMFFDNGGQAGNYPNNDSYSAVFTPDVATDFAQISFSLVDLETCCDNLAVYDGMDNTAPVLNADITAPESFIASTAGGSLFVEFTSDVSVTGAGWEAMFTCGPPPSCDAPANLTATATSDTTADLAWDEEVNASSGYEWVVMVDGEDPNDAMNTPVATGTTPTSTDVTASVTGLMGSTSYDAYVRSNCDADGLSPYTLVAAEFTTLNTPPACGEMFFDNGGQAGDYPNNDSYSAVFTPDVATDLATITFTLVDLEACCDVLMVYDGANDMAPVLSADVPNSTDPQVFTSSTPGGSLFVTFDSDFSVSGAGWEATFTCGPPPSCLAPMNLITANVAATTVDLSWDEEAGATMGYEWVVMADGEDPADMANTPVASGTTATSTDLTATAMGLTAETPYDAYVRSNCDTNGFSDYSDVAEFTTPPSCVAPQNLVVSSITDATADLTWDEEPNATNGYEWVVMADGEDPADMANTPIASGTTATSTDVMATAMGLSENTPYDAYVRANCDTDGFSQFSAVAGFTTPCAVQVPNYSETFDAGVIAPDCWEEASNGTPATGPMDLGFGAWIDDDYLNDTTASGNMDNSARINIFDFGTPNISDWLITPTFDLSGGPFEMVYNVGIKDFNSTNPSDMGSDDMVQVLASIDNGGTWQVLLTYDASNTPSANGEEEIIDLSTFTGNTMFAFYGTAGTQSDPEDYDFFIDEFQVREPLACTPATATFETVADCGSDAFSVDITVSDLGSFASLMVSDDQGSTDQTVTMAGQVATFGPYASGTTVNFTITGDDVACDIMETIQFMCPPANDLCGDSIALTPGMIFSDNPVVGNNVAATDSGETPNPSCYTYSGGDVWYSTTVPGDGNLTIETQGADTGTISDTQITVYSGTCGALTQVGCNDDDGDGLHALVVLADPALANQVVYIRVGEFQNNNFGNFQISAYSATLSTDTFDTQAISLYPNPANDILNISGLTQDAKVSVYNMLGQQVMKSTQATLNVSNLNNGIYLVSIEDEGATKTLRFIKE